MLDRDQYQFAETVAHDLAYLMDEWRPSLDDGELRRTMSPMLRRLLVEDAYGKAWRLVGFDGEPGSPTPSPAATHTTSTATTTPRRVGSRSLSDEPARVTA